MDSHKKEDTEVLLNFKYTRLLRKKQHLYILKMSNKMNIFSFQFCNELKRCLSYLSEKTEGPACLLTMSEIPKTFSAGLDLKILLNRKDRVKSFKLVQSYIEPSYDHCKTQNYQIAVINGHAYAGGLVFALAHDYRIMNQDFGNLCMSQIKHGIPLSPPFNIVCSKRLPYPHFQKIVLTGEPYSPKQGYEARFIDQIYPLEDLEKKAEELGEKLKHSAQHRKALSEIKYEMNKEMLEVLRLSHENLTERMKPKL